MSVLILARKKEMCLHKFIKWSPTGKARACTPKCLSSPKGPMQATVSARRRGLLRRLIKKGQSQMALPFRFKSPPLPPLIKGGMIYLLIKYS